MPPKGKKNKKVDTSWEDEVETAPPNQPAPVAAPVAAPMEPEAAKSPPPTASAEDDFMSGGLLGAIRKNKGKKKNKEKNVADDEEHVTQPVEEPPAVNYEAKAPIEVTEIDEDDFGPIKKGKKGGKQQHHAPKPASPATTPKAQDDGAGDGEIRVKSKKEKEKEKKEREKQRKKEQVC